MRPLRACLAAFVLVGPVAAAGPPPTTKSIPEAVDHHIDQQLKEQGVQPAAPADDATLLRRLTLDLVGRVPTAGELSAYLSSNDTNKQARLVDRLMATNGFQRHLVNEFDAMLAAPTAGRRGPSTSLRDYLTRAIKDNRPWDRVFRDLILADEKDPATKGASVFLKSRIRDLDRLTTDVSVLFFGVNISCAQCHDHPLVQDWKQDHFYGMKSFFARTFEQGPFLGERDVGVVEFKTTKGVTRTANLMFLTGKTIDAPGTKLSPEELRKLRELEKRQARPTKGATGQPPPPPKFSVRAALAELALQPEQRAFFARAVVNRVWHRLFGLGLVTPIDQMHSENAPSHPELLDWLAKDTAENGYDLRRLIRGLVLSKAYARSSRYEGERWPPVRSFAVARLRALTPMQMATSLRLATTDPAQFPATLTPEELDRKVEAIENSARSLANLFEQPRDDFQIGVAEALLFSNNEPLQRDLLADGRDRLAGRLKELNNPEDAVELAVRNILLRPSGAEEKAAIAAYLAQRRDRMGEAYKQMIWALLTSAEFRFNH